MKHVFALTLAALISTIAVSHSQASSVSCEDLFSFSRSPVTELKLMAVTADNLPGFERVMTEWARGLGLRHARIVVGTDSDTIGIYFVGRERTAALIYDFEFQNPDDGPRFVPIHAKLVVFENHPTEASPQRLIDSANRTLQFPKERVWGIYHSGSVDADTQVPQYRRIELPLSAEMPKDELDQVIRHLNNF